MWVDRYFVAYEVVKKQLTPAGQDPSTLNLSAVITAGGLAGVAMWSLAIPPDVRPSLFSSLLSVFLFLLLSSSPPPRTDSLS